MSKDFGQVRSWFAYEAENENGGLVTHFEGGDGEYVSYEDYKELLAAYNKLQQSPAVAVPDDELIGKIKNIWWKAKSSHLMRTDTAREIIQAVLYSSPRITEQDVIAIAQYTVGFMNGTMKDALYYAEKFVGTNEGHNLLNKLNKEKV